MRIAWDHQSVSIIICKRSPQTSIQNKSKEFLTRVRTIVDR